MKSARASSPRPFERLSIPPSVRDNFRKAITGFLYLASFLVLIPSLTQISLAQQRSVLVPRIAVGWNPVKDRVVSPSGGVRLEEGLFKKPFDNNVEYLLSAFTVNQMLKAFRVRAGQLSAEPMGSGTSLSVSKAHLIVTIRLAAPTA